MIWMYILITRLITLNTAIKYALYGLTLKVWVNWPFVYHNIQIWNPLVPLQLSCKRNISLDYRMYQYPSEYHHGSQIQIAFHIQPSLLLFLLEYLFYITNCITFENIIWKYFVELLFYRPIIL